MTRTLVHEHPYHDLQGREVFQHPKWRLDPPDRRGRSKESTYRYRTRHEHVWIFGKPAGADDLLYRLPDLMDEICVPRLTSGMQVWWTEGERDAETLRAMGFVATSHHQAAGHATLEQAETFAGYRGQIVLAADRDRAGAVDVVLRWRLLREVGIHPAQMRIVLPLQRFRGADVTNHFDAPGAGVGDLVPVSIRQARRSAARATPAQLASSSSWFSKGDS